MTIRAKLGLPARWRNLHGAYYYSVPPGQEGQWDGKKLFRLGKTLPDAYNEWAKRLQFSLTRKTIDALFDRYLLSEVPLKEPLTQSSYKACVKNLRLVFGEMYLTDIRPQHVYQYVDKRTAKVAAHREVQVLSAAFSKAVEWGYIDRHPFKGQVRLKSEKPRTRYVNDWEIDEMLNLVCVGNELMAQAYIRVKLLTGISKGDLLRLTMSDLKEDGIHITRHKTKNSTAKSTIYEWTDALRSAVDAAKTVRPIDISPYLFCNRRGESYMNEDTGKAEGWKSLWTRFMERVMTETKITEGFTEHDLRAKVASDAPDDDRARALLSHSSVQTTRKHYRRKAERVQPLH